jgi:hypothetical protein
MCRLHRRGAGRARTGVQWYSVLYRTPSGDGDDDSGLARVLNDDDDERRRRRRRAISDEDDMSYVWRAHMAV